MLCNSSTTTLIYRCSTRDPRNLLHEVQVRFILQQTCAVCEKQSCAAGQLYWTYSASHRFRVLMWVLHVLWIKLLYAFFQLTSMQTPLSYHYNKKLNDTRRHSWGLLLGIVKLTEWLHESFGRTSSSYYISETISKGSLSAATLFYGTRKINKPEKDCTVLC